MLMTGRFGAYGGTYVPEILMPALVDLEAAFVEAHAGKEGRLFGAVSTADHDRGPPLEPGGRGGRGDARRRRVAVAGDSPHRRRPA